MAVLPWFSSYLNYKTRIKKIKPADLTTFWIWHLFHEVKQHFGWSLPVFMRLFLRMCAPPQQSGTVLALSSAVYSVLHLNSVLISAKHFCHQDTKTQKKIKFHRRGAEHAERTFLFNCLWEEGKWKTISLRQKINRQLINFKAKIQFILIRNHAIRRSDLCFARRAWVLLFAVFSTANIKQLSSASSATLRWKCFY